MQSKKYSLNKGDLKSLAIGLGLALAGAALTYLNQAIANVDFGTWTPVVAALWAVVVNVVRKFISEEQA